MALAEQGGAGEERAGWSRVRSGAGLSEEGRVGETGGGEGKAGMGEKGRGGSPTPLPAMTYKDVP